ncbi:hypothetical protein M2169_000034 [Streptomyces sp. MJP52]|nr:hypothetical protein [Streptomyces sp. MJP52]
MRSLTELRTRWHSSAIRAFGACTVYRPAQRAWAAAAAVWARARPVVGVALAAVDVVAVVYVMRGAFKRHHLLAEARRHLSYVLRRRPHQAGLDEQIVQTAVDDYIRPPTCAPCIRAIPRIRPCCPLTRKRTSPPYERARIAADALRVRAQAVRRADRLGMGWREVSGVCVACCECGRVDLEHVARLPVACCASVVQGKTPRFLRGNAGARPARRSTRKTPDPAVQDRGSSCIRLPGCSVTVVAADFSGSEPGR